MSKIIDKLSKKFPHIVQEIKLRNCKDVEKFLKAKKRFEARSIKTNRVFKKENK